MSNKANLTELLAETGGSARHHKSRHPATGNARQHDGAGAEGEGGHEPHHRAFS